MSINKKVLFEDRLYDFEPKSIWDYKKYTEFDKKITDKVASDGLKEDYKKGKNIKEWVKVGGGQRALSKFNSEPKLYPIGEKALSIKINNTIKWLRLLNQKYPDLYHNIS